MPSFNSIKHLLVRDSSVSVMTEDGFEQYVVPKDQIWLYGNQAIDCFQLSDNGNVLIVLETDCSGDKFETPNDSFHHPIEVYTKNITLD